MQALGWGSPRKLTPFGMMLWGPKPDPTKTRSGLVDAYRMKRRPREKDALVNILGEDLAIFAGLSAAYYLLRSQRGRK